MTTVAELIVEALADLGVTHGLGRRRRRAQPGHRRDPPRGPASSGSACATRRPAPSPRAPRRSSPARSACAWAPSAPARSTCSTASTTRRSRTRRCWRICGQVPLAEIGSDFFQEVDNDPLFADVAVFRAHGHRARRRCRCCWSRRCSAALRAAGRRRADPARRRRRRWTSPQGTRRAALRRRRPPLMPDADGAATAAAELIDAAERGHAARRAWARARRATSVLALADRLAAPMVLTLKAKEGLERDNPFEVGQTGLIGNPAARKALDGADAAADGRHRLPLPRLVSRRARPSSRSTRAASTSGAARPVDVGVVGDAAARARRRCCGRGRRRSPTARTSTTRARALRRLARAPARARRPATTTSSLVGQAARRARQPRATRIRPEALAAAIDAHAADDAIFTSDTGMSTVWLSRFVTMRGTRRLIGSYNLGSMANAMPQALGAQALDRDAPGRRVLRRRRPDDAARRPAHRRRPTTCR